MSSLTFESQEREDQERQYGYWVAYAQKRFNAVLTFEGKFYVASGRGEHDRLVQQVQEWANLGNPVAKDMIREAFKRKAGCGTRRK